MAGPAESTADAKAGRRERTIRDFGEQWHHHGANDGFYGSVQLLGDAFGPLLDLEALRGAQVGDIGSGAGRIVRMLIAAGAARVVAVEPSRGVEVLRRNTAEFGDRVEVIHARGEALPADLGLDYVTCIGVLQFIPDPDPVVRAARTALRPGGRFVVWVYASDGNRAYRAFVGALRTVTPRLPHALLSALCGVLNLALDVYVLACRRLPLPLPLREYVRNVLSKVSRDKRRLTIYDQLNPTYVRYYSADELRDLLTRNGFHDVQLHDRHGYSWTAIGTRSPDAA